MVAAAATASVRGALVVAVVVAAVVSVGCIRRRQDGHIVRLALAVVPQCWHDIVGTDIAKSSSNGRSGIVTLNDGRGVAIRLRRCVPFTRAYMSDIRRNWAAVCRNRPRAAQTRKLRQVPGRDEDVCSAHACA